MNIATTRVKIRKPINPSTMLTKATTPTSLISLQPSRSSDSPQGTRNTYNDDYPEDILSDSLQTLYEYQPVALTSPGMLYTYTHVKAAPMARPIKLTLQTPDPEAVNWSLHASSVWIASVQLASGVDFLRIDSHLGRVASPIGNSGSRTGKRLSVLELGASAGLPSILLAKLYPDISVLATDYPDSQIIQTLICNIKQNGVELNCRAAPYAWGTDPAPLFELASTRCTQLGFDMIIAADTLWNPDSHSIFIDTLQLTLHKGPDARVHLVAGLHTGRYTIESFLRSVEHAGFCVVDIVEREALGAGTSEMMQGRTRTWDISRAEHEQEKDRREWVIWIELCWSASQLVQCA